jgi:hypothetical protein
MARITDANLAFAGQEPKFSIELTQTDLSKTLAWYAQNKDKNDAFKYACDYFKKKLKIDASSVLKSKVATFGFVCRIVSNGGSLPIKNQVWFDSEIEDIKKALAKKPVDDSPVVKTNVINIQDRIREKASECIGELEGQIDDLILSGFKANVAPYAIFHTMNIKDAQTKFIVDWAKGKRIEFDEVLNTDDEQIKEGWSNYTKPQIKKLVAYCDQVILDCQKVSGESTKSRKPRKRKAKSPEQLTAKMKYMTEFKELNLTSIKVTDIIGSMVLWVYNTKTRKLGVYHADDAGGLSVKGSGILNFSESKSIQKKLRKPEQMLPEVLSGGKVFLRNVMDSIRAVDSKLTGRINGDTILLRVVK